jgi:hypothetical protein
MGAAKHKIGGRKKCIGIIYIIFYLCNKKGLDRMNDGSEPRDGDLEWENRVLCSDESCIGTIGPDGRCRECGRPYEGILPDPMAPVSTKEAASASNGDTEPSTKSHPPAASETPIGDEMFDENSDSVTDDEWGRRALCPDESCIGVIGPDGRCKECGRSL